MALIASHCNYYIINSINQGSNLQKYAARNSFTSKLLVLLSYNTLLFQGFCTPFLKGGTIAKSRTDPQVRVWRFGPLFSGRLCDPHFADQVWELLGKWMGVAAGLGWVRVSRVKGLTLIRESLARLILIPASVILIRGSNSESTLV